MSLQTVTRAAESDLEPIEIYKVLADVSNLPRWAPAFADSIESTDKTHFRVTKNGDSFDMELFLHPAALAVDYIREMADHRRGGAYIRVTPRPLGGSAVIITVPIAPTTNESDVAKVLEQELAEIIRLTRP
ncbi:hypothetical protein FTW19_23540 [Terriglobus albidus]|uniref:SRPBCC family protein n=1 Tax=Terriglobus albidus TaxID=1592106 RepID=A0A5B9EHY0_9BACT|nr:SRPBCC family protein [Terriglobus albidus]QEE30705.1 hypothetical protein FTW19_23540 [Terriglobus albidus]